MANENARNFLARVAAWDPQEQAYVNLHWCVPNQHDKTKKAWRGRAVHSNKNAINSLEYALKQPNTRDMYFCVSSQREADVRTSAKGHKWYAAKRNAANAVACKLFVIDLDVKEGAYPDQGAALTDFARVKGELNLPQPTAIVGSGTGGVHIYWTLVDPLPPDEWSVFARALTAALQDKGLLFDSQCTVDIARIMRVPDTLNWKTDPPSPVTLGHVADHDIYLGALAKPLDAYLQVVRANPSRSVTPASNPAFAALGTASEHMAKDAKEANTKAAAGITGDLIDLEHVAKECAFLRDTMATGGRDLPNPLWHLTVLIATFGQDGETKAHQMSAGHANYTYAETQELFERKKHEAQELGLGWPHCSTIQTTGASQCAACPHRAANKTPLHLRVSPALPAVLAATLQTPPGYATKLVLPPGFVHQSDNIIVREEMREDGSIGYRPIMTSPVFAAWIQTNPYVLHFVTEVTPGVVETIALPFRVTASTDAFKRCIHEAGLPIAQKATPIALEFFVSWQDTLRRTKSAIVDSRYLGWAMSGSKLTGFAYGGHTWSKGQPSAAAQSKMGIATRYTPKGDIAPWHYAASLITNQKNPALDMLLASAFAAPLVRFTGHHGMTLSAYSSESGVGKSSALKVAQAVWGDPVRAMSGLEDTPTQLVERLGDLQCLPMYWDELKDEMQTKKFVKLLFELTSGKGRARMTSDLEYREVRSHQTMLTVATNDPLIEYVVQQLRTSEAGMYRLFEVNVPDATGQGIIADHIATRAFADLEYNYGNAGEVYAKWLGANYDIADKDVAKTTEWFAKELGAQQNERFWFALAAVLVVGAQYSNQLGLAQIDVPMLAKYMADQIKEMRKMRDAQPVDMRKSDNLVDVLARFLTEHSGRYTLTTDHIHMTMGPPMLNSVKVLNDTSRMDVPYVQMGRDDGLCRIQVARFGQWLRQEGYSRTVINKQLLQQLQVEAKSGRIGAGTLHRTLTMKVLTLDLNDPAFGGAFATQ